MDEVCYISNKYQPPYNLAKRQYFYTRDFISYPHFGKNDALDRKRFSKHPLFTAFSLFLKVSEVCNISNKCWLPYKSLTKLFLYKASETAPSFPEKNCALHGTSFQKHPLFTPFLLVFTVDEVCYISNKHQPPYDLVKRQYFYARGFISLLHFGK